MSSVDSLPPALFGGTLLGDRALRFIFTDEAGISAKEAHTVVVGILVDADSELVKAEALVQEILGSVPKGLKDEFVFSAKAVWGNKRYYSSWEMADRLKLLKSMMSVPKRLSLPIALATHPRALKVPQMQGRSLHQHADFQHAMTFANCMSRADKYIREAGRPSEVGTIVAENVDKGIKSLIRAFVQSTRDNPLTFSGSEIHWSESDKAQGYCSQETEIRISRIRKTIHFVEKNEELLIQVADAVAYGIRAYLNDKQFGDQFINAIGIDMEKATWQEVGGYCVCWPKHA